MIINSSTLSMDAYSGHTEVNSVAGYSATKTKSSWSMDTTFELSLSDDEAVEVEETSQTAEVEEGIESSETTQSDDILETVLSELLGSDVELESLEVSSSLTVSESITVSSARSKSPFTMLLGSTKVEEKTDTFEFMAEGTIETEDGRSIEFNLDLSVTREETVQSGFGLGKPIFLDPLILSFEDGLANLSSSFFSFDLNGDGELEEIPALGSGSGFLALDLDEDGVINDGTELFGPVSGFGFNELRQYDLDDNNWIDENDPIFSQLYIWKCAGGEDEELISLEEAGVGAISLGFTDSFFDLKNSEGLLLGVVKRSGIFFMEDGAIRALQEIDFNLEASAESEEGELIETLEQAIAALNEIANRRKEIALARLNRFSMLASSQETLEEKFWSWHKEATSDLG